MRRTAPALPTEPIEPRPLFRTQSMGDTPHGLTPNPSTIFSKGAPYDRDMDPCQY